MLVSFDEIEQGILRSYAAKGEGEYNEFEVKASSIQNAGLGLYSTGKKIFKPGEVILIYGGRLNQEKDKVDKVDKVDKENKVDDEYIFQELDFKINGDPRLEPMDGQTATIASYANDGKFGQEKVLTNAEYELIEIPKDHMIIKNYSEYTNYLLALISKRKILKNEEIFVDYSDDFWNTHFINKIKDLLGFGVACSFTDANGNIRVYIGTIMELGCDFTIVWSDADSELPIEIQEKLNEIESNKPLYWKKKYEVFQNFYLAGSDVFYPKDTPIVHPLINKNITLKKKLMGRRIKGKRKQYQLQNWKIDSIKNTEDTEDESNIVITITRNESQIEESFDMNLNVFQKKLKSGIIIIQDKTFTNHDGFDIPFLNNDVKYRLEDSFGCESFCKSIAEQQQIDELKKTEKEIESKIVHKGNYNKDDKEDENSFVDRKRPNPIQVSNLNKRSRATETPETEKNKRLNILAEVASKIKIS